MTQSTNGLLTLQSHLSAGKVGVELKLQAMALQKQC